MHRYADFHGFFSCHPLIYNHLSGTFLSEKENDNILMFVEVVPYASKYYLDIPSWHTTRGKFRLFKWYIFKMFYKSWPRNAENPKMFLSATMLLKTVQKMLSSDFPMPSGLQRCHTSVLMSIILTPCQHWLTLSLFLANVTLSVNFCIFCKSF